MPDAVVSLRDAAREIGRHPDTLTRWVRDGTLEVVRRPGQDDRAPIQVRMDAVLAAAAAHVPARGGNKVGAAHPPVRGDALAATQAHLADVQRDRDRLARELADARAELAGVRVELADKARRLDVVERELAGGVRGLLTTARKRLGL